MFSLLTDAPKLDFAYILDMLTTWQSCAVVFKAVLEIWPISTSKYSHGVTLTCVKRIAYVHKEIQEYSSDENIAFSK